jgi:hypothetical protein
MEEESLERSFLNAESLKRKKNKNISEKICFSSFMGGVF